MHDISVSVLSSGSCGNSFLVKGPETSFLLDAGLACRELERRISCFGLDTTQVEGVVLTHEHVDHIRGVRRFCAVHNIPVYGTRGTLALTDIDGTEKRVISAGKEFSIGGVRLKPFKVRHLAAEPVGFSMSVGTNRVGVASDLGCITANVLDELSGVELMFVEANYDERMLLEGAYPDFLKRTIKGDHGHLSNEDAGLLSSKASSSKTRKVVLVHLSAENNTPEKARSAVEESLKRHRRSVEVGVSEHGNMSGPYGLG
ncbi:MAG: MBL fold metallo-hydrolase [Thermoplasmata archaeon]|jgi:phosphoribosyl 1,2-cyclic phosphodiesterase|nr:MBL fold metallo-hydrolase [Thermoplasmata archaeon]